MTALHLPQPPPPPPPPQPLSQVIVAAGPDVVALQEVRHDDNFGPVDPAEATNGAPPAKGTSLGASQMRHLADRLAPHGYAYYAYHPAMSYYAPGNQGGFAPSGGLLREEEGPGFLSRLPISAVDHLLLPRDPRDGDDGHSRAVLHAAVTVPWWPPNLGAASPPSPSPGEGGGVVGGGSGGARGSLDVYSVHLSLSEAARNRAAPLLSRYAARGGGHAQVLMGDLNAEPHEPAMAFLRGEGPLLDLAATREVAAATAAAGVAAAGTVAEGGSGAVAGRAFVDAWLARHPEPRPGSREAWDLDHALTFPACNPVKRIDYILVRANTGGGGGGGPPAPRWAVEVVSAEVVGQAPSAATAGYTAREGLGMLDDDSPLWASDHRAVVATLRLIPAP